MSYPQSFSQMIQNWFVVEVTQPVNFSVALMSRRCHLLPTTQQSEGRKSIVNPSLRPRARCWPGYPKEREQGLNRAGCKGDSSSSNRMKLSPLAPLLRLLPGLWGGGRCSSLTRVMLTANRARGAGQVAAFASGCNRAVAKICVCCGRRKRFPSLSEMFCQSSAEPLPSQIRSAGDDQK